MKIPSYSPQVQPNAATIGQDREKFPVAPNAGEGLMSLGEGFMRLGEGIERQAMIQKREADKRQREQDELWSINSMTDLRSEALEQYRQMQERMPDGGDGFTKSVDDYYKDLTKVYADRAPNQQAKLYFEGKAAAYSNQLLAHAITDEAQERVDYKVRSNAKGIQADGENIRLDPTALESITADRMKGISTLRGSMRDKLVAEMSKEYTRAYLGTQVATNPRDALQKIDDGTYTRVFRAAGLNPDADIMRAFRHQAATQADGKDRMLANQIQGLIDSDVASRTNTGEGVNDFRLTKESFNQAFGTEQGAIHWENYQGKVRRADGIYQALSATELKPVSEVQKYLQSIEPVAGSKDYDEKMDVYKAVVAEVGRRQRILHDDPFAAVDQVLVKADVSMGFDTMGNPRSGEGAIMRQDDYARRQMNLALQDIAGVPKEKQKVMSNQGAKDMVAQLNAMPPDQIQKSLDTLEKAYGPQFGMLFKQLQEHKLNPGTSLILWSANTPVGNLIVDAQKTPTKDAKEASGLQDPDIVKVGQAVEDAIRPFISTITKGGINSARASQIEVMNSTLTKAVLMKIGTMNRSVGDMAAAVKEVVDPLIKDRYNLYGTYYIPKVIGEQLGQINSGKPIDPDITRKNLDTLKSTESLTKFNPNKFGSRNWYLGEGALQESLIDTAANSGYWVTNETGDGVYLAVTAGSVRGLPVRNAKGERYEFKFLDLQGPVGRSTSGRIRRPE